MGQISKQRTPGKCREWERERRNKFSQAINNLWDLVKTVNKESDYSQDVTQCPKVEVIHRAIVVITKIVEERSKYKAQILALEVELEKHKVKHGEEKSTQTDFCKKSGKIVKETTKCKTGKANSTVPATDLAIDVVTSSASKPKPQIAAQPAPNYAKILPMTTAKAKKNVQENTIVVMPATPYLIPQRQFLFPAQTPTLVLLNPNIQSTNKPTIQTLNRTNNDITKTTMVNILPISAYSRPLSAKKTKRQKSVKSKRKHKLEKNKKQTLSDITIDSNTKNHKCDSKEQNNTSEKESRDRDPLSKTENSKDKNINNKGVLEEPNTHIVDVKQPVKASSESSPSVKQQPANVNDAKTLHETSKSSVSNILNTSTESISNNNKSDNIKKLNDDKRPSEEKSKNVTWSSNNKETVVSECSNLEMLTSRPIEETAKKHEKIPLLLHNNICENTVDGGNARLELAEELLAASPTAAFLMSFPLVSGNRADSPADEPQSIVTNPSSKINTPTIGDKPPLCLDKYKSSDQKEKSCKKVLDFSSVDTEKPVQNKRLDINTPAKNDPKPAITTKNSVSDASLLNLQIPSVIPSSCTFGDPVFSVDYDYNISKSIANQSSFASNASLLYKNENFNSMKNSIYSSSNISSGHEFNSLGLYPCALDKYTAKSKDHSNADENIMKIGSSRLTYDIDLGWSHKGLDFVSSSANAVNITKENLMPAISSSYSTVYNPFNPEIHVPLASNALKKDHNRLITSFPENISNFYSQTSNLWSEDAPFYSTSNLSLPKTSSSKNLHVPTSINHPHSESNKQVQVQSKVCVNKMNLDNNIAINSKSNNIDLNQHLSERFNKKPAASKMHINWMTSEIRPQQTIHNGNFKDQAKHSSYNVPCDQTYKKTNHINENNYFPINVQSFSGQSTTEEFNSWTPTKTHGTTEISIEPPPLNLPTLVGDLALGPHEKRRPVDVNNRSSVLSDSQSANTFLSVTQLMNPAGNNMPIAKLNSTNNTQGVKSVSKQSYFEYENNYKSSLTNYNGNLTNSSYTFNDAKSVNSYDSVNINNLSKTKVSKGPEKINKAQKNNYSAEALIRGSSVNQKAYENKFMMTTQKYSNYNSHQHTDSNVAQVSHFPAVLDYTDNNIYSGQQFAGSTPYNTNNNGISNAFYNNFMPGNSNIMASNYSGHSFTGEIIDYNQANDCNYPQQKYEEFKMKPNVITNDKVNNQQKNNKRETSKHKIDCNKKESSKKYQSKRAKLVNEVENNNWGDNGGLLWQNKALNKRHTNPPMDELLPNYVGNQMPPQYQTDIFNTHHMPANAQSVGHFDRSLTSFPTTSRANFNLSTIFPEITMKVQS